MIVAIIIMDIKIDVGEMLGRIRFEYFSDELEVTDLIQDLQPQASVEKSKNPIQLSLSRSIRLARQLFDGHH